jgi:NAD dependent epimerase/dehydratase family enzyme
LNGSRISANKIKQAGFKFKFENLEKALKNLR